MKKVLHIIHGLNVGGAETFISNVLDGIDSRKIKFDFAIQNPDIKNKNLESLINEKGGNIFIIPDFRKSPLDQFRQLKEILNEGYNYVHVHMNAFINTIPVLVASRFKNTEIIIHSHNTQNNAKGAFGAFLHNLNSKLFLKDRFIKVACGKEAGRWMFKSKEFQVINNAVSLEKFKYSEENNKIIRESLSIPLHASVIGHIGRFTPVKNQRFLLDIFASFRNKFHDINPYLILVGTGHTLEEMKGVAKMLGISDYVRFTGPVGNPQDYYSAFDCFVLPSLFEGLAFVAVEAQAAGLNIVASTNNTPDINISGNVKFVDLNNKDEWVESIYSAIQNINRGDVSNKLLGSEFDDKILHNKMNSLYDL